MLPYLDTTALFRQIREAEAEVIGRTLVHLVGDRNVCRYRECNLGNLIADGALRRCLMSGGPGWSQVRRLVLAQLSRPGEMSS